MIEFVMAMVDKQKLLTKERLETVFNMIDKVLDPSVDLNYS